MLDALPPCSPSPSDPLPVAVWAPLAALVTGELGASCYRTTLMLACDPVMAQAAERMAGEPVTTNDAAQQLAQLQRALHQLRRLAKQRHPFALKRSSHAGR